MEHHQNAQVAPPYDMQQAQLTAMMFSLSQNGSSLSYPPPRSGFGGPSPNMWAPHVYPQNAFMGMPGMFTNSEALAQMAKMYAGLPPQTPEPCWRGPLLKGRGSSKGRFSKTKIGSEEDNEIVVEALQSGLADGKTHCQVLEELEGVHGHDAETWKDYYLEQWDMIDRNVRKRALTSTNPSGSAVGVFPLSVSRVKSTEHSSAREGRSMSGRSRVPTVTLKAQKQDPKPSFDLNAKDVAIPTRSPSPPTRILKKRGGQFAYTPEDKEYFIKVIKYMHAYHPTLTPSEVLDYLAKKAPHHSANSWTWHWKRSKCDLPWELRYANFATARIHSKSIGSDMSESGSDRESASSGSEAESRSQKHEPLKIRLRPLLRVSREAALEPAPGIGHEVELESTDDEGKVMGIGGGPITDGDKRAVAFNLMTLTNNPDYENMSEADKWLQFALRYPQRSYRAWAQLYRNHKTDIDGRVCRYKKRVEMRVASTGPPVPELSAVRMATVTADATPAAEGSLLGKRKATSPPMADGKKPQ